MSAPERKREKEKERVYHLERGRESNESWVAGGEGVEGDHGARGSSQGQIWWDEVRILCPILCSPISCCQAHACVAMFKFVLPSPI